MFRHALHRTTLSILLAFASALPAGALAQDRDTKEVNAYVLTEASLAKYSKATRALNAAAPQVAGSCDDEGEGAQSIDRMVARINAVPKAKAAIQSAGMSTREYVVFGLSVFQTGLASWGLSQPGGKLPPGVSMANVKFYRAHEAAIQQIKPAESDCDDASAEEEPEQ